MAENSALLTERTPTTTVGGDQPPDSPGGDQTSVGQVLAPAFLTFLLFAAIVGAYLFMAFKHPLAYIWGTYEDLIGEWAQVWFLVAALLFSIRIIVINSRYRLFFGLLAVSCLYVVLEEISWGQRIFGFKSPDFFKTENLQGETNIHNFLTGPYGTTLKHTIAYVLAAALAIYGLALPLAVRRRWRFAEWLDARGLATPPLYLWPFFVTAAYLELTPFRFNEAEVAEFLVGFALAITALHYLVSMRHDCSPHRMTGWPKGKPTRLALLTGLTMGIVLTLSVCTTFAIYSSPSGKRRIDNRVKNGIEKFAGRYARYEQWEMAAYLYERLRVEKPNSMATLRKLANSYRRAGDSQKYDEFISEALRKDMIRYKKDPDAASVNRSLVRTYRIMDNDPKANEHLKRALRIGRARIEKHPTSANAAYSIAKTYALMDRDAEALVQFKRAFKLKPTTKKFKKAYLKARLRQQR